MSWSRWTRVAVVCALAVPISSFISASPSFAAGCHASGCNGRNPVSMGCDRDAVTLNQAVFEDHASGGTFGRQVVALRHSSRCNASWSRVTATAGGTASVTTSTAYIGSFRTSTRRSRSGHGTVYSNMRAGSTVHACGRTSFNHGAVIKSNCVAPH